MVDSDPGRGPSRKRVSKMFERILLPLDGSTLAECVLPHAVALSRATNAQLVLLHVVEPVPEQGPMATDPLHWHLLKAETRAYLDEISERLRRVGLAVEGVQLEGPAARSEERRVGKEGRSRWETQQSN